MTVSGIVKSQFGGNQITRNATTNEILSITDDLKASATDALKKCASMLGVGLHLYSKQKPTEPKPKTKPVIVPPVNQPAEPAMKETPQTKTAEPQPKNNLAQILTLNKQNSFSQWELLGMVFRRFRKKSLEELTQDEIKIITEGLSTRLKKVA